MCASDSSLTCDVDRGGGRSRTGPTFLPVEVTRLGAGLPALGDEAHAEIHETGHAGVNDAVQDALAVAAGVHDPLIRKALQLVRHRLLSRADRLCDVRRTDLTAEMNGVQDAQPVVVGQHLEQLGEVAGPRVGRSSPTAGPTHTRITRPTGGT